MSLVNWEKALGLDINGEINARETRLAEQEKRLNELEKRLKEREEQVKDLETKLKTSTRGGVMIPDLFSWSEIAKSLNLSEEYLTRRAEENPRELAIELANARDQQINMAVQQLEAMEITIDGASIWKVFEKARLQYNQNPEVFTNEVREAITATRTVERLAVMLHMINYINTSCADGVVKMIVSLSSELDEMRKERDELETKLRSIKLEMPRPRPVPQPPQDMPQEGFGIKLGKIGPDDESEDAKSISPDEL